MCSPTILAGVGIGSTVVGSGFSSFGAYTQGQSESDRMKFQADVAEDNAELAEYAAKDAKKRGAQEERKHNQRVKLLVGSQKAAYSSSGVDITSGAPADIMGETILMGEADAATIRHNAAMEAWGLKSRASGYRAEAGQYRAGAKGASLAGNIGAGATLLTGLGSAAFQGWRYNQIGKNTIRPRVLNSSRGR